MEPQFFQTNMGRKFYNGDLPELIRQLKRLNDNLEKQNIVSLSAKSDAKIEQMSEKECADLVVSVLPEATVVKKDIPYNLTEEQMQRILGEDNFNEAIRLTQEFIGQPDGGVAGIHFSGFETDDNGGILLWQEETGASRNREKRRKIIIDYLFAEKAYDHYDEKRTEPEPDIKITITRYTPEQARKIMAGVVSEAFLEDRQWYPPHIEKASKVIAVLGVLLPNCGELYISELDNGNFWTMGGRREEFGTLDQCIKLLKEEFL